MQGNLFIKIGKIFIKVIIIIFLVIAIFVGGLTAIHCFATKYEKASNPPVGKMVNVNNKKMHVYIEGQGKFTFVILSGGGIGAPVLEYAPLRSQLEKHGRVVTVEYMGYGWSDETNDKRTSENIVEEIRAALKEADVKPPYTLVAHSIGGIYAMKYAQLHEDELSAIIGLDTTLPRGIVKTKENNQTVNQVLPPFREISLLRKFGLLRTMLYFNPLLISGAPEGVYSKDEAKMIGMVTNWNYANNTVINEFQSLEENMYDLVDYEFPSDLPVLLIQAHPKGEQEEIYRWSLSERRRLTKNLIHGKVVEMSEGHSGIYWKMSNDIVEETLSFLKY